MKLFSSNLNIWFALKSIHITLEITWGWIYARRFRFYSKNSKISSPWKNQKLPPNTNMFFQPMSDFYTLFMGLLCHIHDLKLWNLVRFWSFLLSDTGKWLHSESGQISVQSNIFQQYFLIMCWIKFDFL